MRVHEGCSKNACGMKIVGCVLRLLRLSAFSGRMRLHERCSSTVPYTTKTELYVEPPLTRWGINGRMKPRECCSSTVPSTTKMEMYVKPLLTRW